MHKSHPLPHVLTVIVYHIEWQASSAPSCQPGPVSGGNSPLPPELPKCSSKHPLFHASANTHKQIAIASRDRLIHPGWTCYCAPGKCLTMDGARPSRPDRPYQRTYKACIPCRQRKAKCDLGTGPDGLPIGPPCARCRREMRECVFPEKRAWERSRKRGRSIAASNPLPLISNRAGLGRSLEDNENRISPGEEQLQGAIVSPDDAKRQFTPGHQNVQYPQDSTSPFQQGWAFARPNPSPHNDHSSQIGISPQPIADGSMQANTSPAHAYQENRHRSSSTLASSMMRTVVASGNDALNILFEAATAGQDDKAPCDESPPRGAGSKSAGSNNHQRETPKNFESPAAFETVSRAKRPVEISEVAPETLQIWEACRFVKMGWFTAREAVTFIDL